MNKLFFVLMLSGICCLGSLDSLNAQNIVTVVKSPGNDPAQPSNTAGAPKRSDLDGGSDRLENVRIAILPLLKGVFNTRRNGQEVLLTIDAGWRNDSLSIEYKYYNGFNLLALDENLLVEKIYFTFKPGEIDALDTENDEFQFLYLRNKKKRKNIHQLVSRPVAAVKEETWCSSIGFPVRTENLPTIIQLLKELRSE